MAAAAAVYDTTYTSSGVPVSSSIIYYATGDVVLGTYIKIIL